jgi:hypothetical protein
VMDVVKLAQIGFEGRHVVSDGLILDWKLRVERYASALRRK